MLNLPLIVYIKHVVNTTSVHKADTSNPENDIYEQDRIILNLIVSNYDCAKQNTLRHISLLNVEPCKQAYSDKQHTRTQATLFVRAIAKRIKAFKGEAYVKT